MVMVILLLENSLGFLLLLQPIVSWIGSNDGSTIAALGNNIIISDGSGNNRIQVNSSGTTSINTDGATQLILHRE